MADVDRRTTLTATVLDAPDPELLGRFWADLLGWELRVHDVTFVTARPPDGGAGLSFQVEPLHRRPTWPSTTADQQMQMHLDVEVDDLVSAVGRATSLGATLADHQPQEDVRVLLDPAGHPFCLWVSG